MRSLVWKIARRLAALNYAYRPLSAAKRSPNKPRARNAKLSPAGTDGEPRGESKSHILFLAGDLAAIKNLLRREKNMPVRVRKLRCASVSIAGARDLHALAVMRALKESLEVEAGPPSLQARSELAAHRRGISARKH
jgi:hypothetical protein